MSRQSSNETVNGIIKNGFSYEWQCWIIGYRVQNCGHPETMRCGCYGREHQGELISATE